MFPQQQRPPTNNVPDVPDASSESNIRAVVHASAIPRSPWYTPPPSQVLRWCMSCCPTFSEYLSATFLSIYHLLINLRFCYAATQSQYQSELPNFPSSSRNPGPGIGPSARAMDGFLAKAMASLDLRPQPCFLTSSNRMNNNMKS